MKPRKLPYVILSVILGLAYFVFGLNYFLHFLNMPPDHPAPFMAFMNSLVQTNILTVVKVLEVIGGILLISQRFHILALTILTPITVVILLTHIFADPIGIPISLILVGLNVALILARWNTFKVVLNPN